MLYRVHGGVLTSASTPGRVRSGGVEVVRVGKNLRTTVLYLLRGMIMRYR